ncbi:MAG: hypothetical protein ACE369_11920 [Roseovarius sp.]
MRKPVKLLAVLLAVVGGQSVNAKDFARHADDLRDLVHYDGPATSGGLTRTSFDIRPDCVFTQKAQGRMDGVDAVVVMTGDLRDVAPEDIAFETKGDGLAIRFDVAPPAPAWKVTTRIEAGNDLYDLLVTEPKALGALMPADCTEQGCEMTMTLPDDGTQQFFRLILAEILTEPQAEQATNAFRDLAELCRGKTQ